MQGITNKTDKQLLKDSKLELLRYIRELEDIITDHACEVVVGKSQPVTDPTANCTDQTPHHLTSYTFSNTVTKKDIYSF